MQISVTRTGRRADIDVDYRSSAGPQALLNGHLTAANSDVRAGNNYERHSSRWSGYENWWRNLVGLFRPSPPQDVIVALDVNVAGQPGTRSSEPVSKAVLDFFSSWLVEGRPEAALSYISVKSYACLAEYQTGEGIGSGLAALRILGHLRQDLAAYGKAASLDEVIQAVPLRAAGAKPVAHDHESWFTLEQLPGNVARAMDCRVRFHTNLAEPLPDFSNTLGDSYASITQLKKEQSPVYFRQVWTKEEGYWKVVSWHIEHPSIAGETPGLAGREAATPASYSGQAPDERLIREAERFFAVWLIERRYDQAAAVFAPQVNGCSAVKDAGGPQGLLAAVADQLPRKERLEELIETVEHGHPHMQEARHAHGQAFLVARVSDELAAMSACGAPAPGRRATAGAPTFRKNTFQTIFRIKDAPGGGAALQLQWARRGNDWKIVALEIAS